MREIFRALRTELIISTMAVPRAQRTLPKCQILNPNKNRSSTEGPYRVPEEPEPQRSLETVGYRERSQRWRIGPGRGTC